MQNQLSEPDPTNIVLKPWVDFAKTKYHNNCKMIVDPGSATGIAQSLEDSALRARREDLKQGEYIVALIAQGSMGS